MCWTSTGASSASSSSSSRLQPLPEKFVMKGVVDRFSEEFVETRMKALDKFLRRVADHPVLSFNPHLNAFLTAKVSPPSPLHLRPTSIPSLSCDTFLVQESRKKTLLTREGRNGQARWANGCLQTLIPTPTELRELNQQNYVGSNSSPS